MDKAILRTGRFDKKIFIPAPDFESRKALFNFYLHDRPHKNIDFDILAKRSDKYPASDIEYIIAESAREAVDRNMDYINNEIIIEVIASTKSSILDYLDYKDKPKARKLGFQV